MSRRVLVSLLVVCALPSPSSTWGSSAFAAMDPALRCAQDLLVAKRKYAGRLRRCYSSLAADHELETFFDCRQTALDRINRAVDVAIDGAEASGGGCGFRVGRVRYGDTDNYTDAALRATVMTSEALPSRCVAKKSKAAGRFISQHLRCAKKDVARPNSERLGRCTARGLQRFERAWERADSTGPCQPTDSSHLRVDFVTALQSDLPGGYCSDGVVQAQEQCDDANLNSGDGCSANCLAESCPATGGSTGCIHCPLHGVLSPDHGGCVCLPGYEMVGSRCKDIDECRGGGHGCSSASACVNLEGTYSCSVECTAEAFAAALQNCGEPTGVITFDCRDRAILVPADAAVRTVRCSGLVIDGLDRNVSFEMDPPCFLGSGEGCPAVDNGAVFLELAGDNNTVRNLTVRHFFDGVHTSGAGNLVERVLLERQCDDSLSNDTSGRGNVFRDLQVRDGCDKCVQNFGDPTLASGDLTAASGYNAVFDNVSLSGCVQPIRMTDGGRFLITESFIFSRSGGPFSCDGPRFSSGAQYDLAVYLSNSVVDGCRRGVRLGGDAEAVLDGNTISGSALRAVLMQGTARASLEANTIRDNGGGTSAELGFGGVAVGDDAIADLGGGGLVIDGLSRSSRGGNLFCRNVSPGGLEQSVHNLSQTGRQVTASNNSWCGNPADMASGDVVFDPYSSLAP
ncbi:MAG: right-handed parallel beta-helix repeat-containing protein [Candidatus Binatia bacterium]